MDAIVIITVIPQYDICPQQTQYPIKEVRKVKSRITKPETQIKFNLILYGMFIIKSSFCSTIFNLIQIPRIQCTIIKDINIDAPRIWK